MKNICLLVMLLLYIPQHGHAQNVNMTRPQMWLGKTPALVTVDGKQERPETTIADILSAPRLTMTPPGWTIDSYNIGIRPAGNKDYVGPFAVKGSELTAAAIEAIRKQQGHIGTIEIESVKAIGPDGQKRTVNPMYISYAQ